MFNCIQAVSEFVHIYQAKTYWQQPGEAEYVPSPNKRYCKYRVFIKYCVFSLKFCDFSELCQSGCSAGFLPAGRVYTHTDTEKGQSPGYFKIFGEKKIYLMNTLYFLKAVSVADRPQIADP